MSSPDEDDPAVTTPLVIRPPPETPTPSGSLRDAERMAECYGQNDSASTGTGTSGSHIDANYAAATSPAVVPHPVVRGTRFVETNELRY